MVDGASRPQELRYAYVTLHTVNGKGEYYAYDDVRSESLTAVWNSLRERKT